MINTFQRLQRLVFLITLLLAFAVLPPIIPAQEKSELIKGLERLSESEKNELLSTMTGEREGPPIDKPKPPPKPPNVPKIEEAPSNVEKVLSGQFPTDILRDLRQYGYDFFRTDIPAFTPITNIPVGSDYIIGPGDEIEIFMWGRIDSSFSLLVDNEGTINIPNIGMLTVAGLTFGELKKLIKRKVEAITGVNANVSMGRLRTIDVFIVGEAKNPATYSLSSLSTVISALYASGGPSKNGSLRGIRVFRNGDVATKLDLYDFFIRGTKENDIRLQTGDTIFIPVIGPVAGVAGAVRRPGIYEMNGEKTVGDFIELSGGILPTGELQNVVIERIEGNKRRLIKSFNLDPSSVGTDKNLKMPLNDFDVIKIYPIYKDVDQVVYLEGHVKYPREYELKPGMRILDIIPSYNALLPEPYLPQAEIIRLMPPDSHPEIIQFNLGALMGGDDRQNLQLRGRDRIIIYDKWEKKERPQITVKGAVRDPGTYPLYKGMTIKDLIFQAGNLTDKAYADKATLTRVVPGPTGTDITEMEFSPKKAMAGLSPDNILLEKDDGIRIREIPRYNQALAQKVYLEGEFLFPGEYSFSDGDRLSSVIEKAGGLTEYAYPFGAMFYREAVRRLQERRFKEYIDKLEEDVLNLNSQLAEESLDETQSEILKQTMDSKKRLLEKMKQERVTGRMVINLPEILGDSTSRNNFELRAGDRLVVEKRPDSVNITGEVYNPTAVLVEDNKTESYYLDRVGGITPDAEEKRMYLVKANGSVISKSQEGFFGMTTWDTDSHRWVMGFEGVSVDPGDTIIVPKKVEGYPFMRLTKDITQILYQIAVGAGVIVAAF